MPCNAISMIRTKLDQPTSLNEAIKELTHEQACKLAAAVIKEITKLNAWEISGVNSTAITNGEIEIRITGKPAVSGATIRKLNEMANYRQLTETRFNELTIKAAGLIKQAKAIQSIKARYGGEAIQAPNGSTIITLDL